VRKRSSVASAGLSNAAAIAANCRSLPIATASGMSFVASVS
jgi:hypothetical protein